jgi:hypothetical protein
VPPKPTHTRLDEHNDKTLLIVKIREGEALSIAGNHLLGRGSSNLTLADTLFGHIPGARLARLFSRSEQELSAEKLIGEANTGQQLADLNLYVAVHLPAATPPASIEWLADALNNLDLVEIAYPAAIPEVARADIPPATPNFEPSQGYLNAAPNGVDARYAWQIAGGNGYAMRFIDVEFAWRTSHEDLKDPFVTLSSVAGADLEHGTAVLGEIIGDQNGFGITGIAPQANYGTSAASGAVADAINAAAGQLAYGDAIEIELHTPSTVNTGESCSCNFSQCMYVPMEFYQAEYDAISHATALGINVVEAAGNGGTNLDNAAYGGRFNRSVRDSGAIMVGAATPAGGPECFTNYGSRVDVHGIGDSVVTTGYGDLFNPGDPNQYYTQSFSGTSSATPMVTGSVLDLQGAKRARTGSLYAPFQVRGYLSHYGSTQFSGLDKPIGPLPNLRDAINGSTPRLTNISTRADVLTGNNVMIAGFIITGSSNKTVAIVATGPSLAAFGITNPLADPYIILVRQSDQAVIATNDNWQSASNAFMLQAAGFAPSNPLEAALYVNLAPGAYTVIVQGNGGGTGVSVVSVNEVDRPEAPLYNISTRADVLTGNNVAIAGFAISGDGPLTVVIQGTGPSLVPYGISNPLPNPTLTLVRSADGAVLATNDNWQSAPNAAAIQASGFAPTNPYESAIMMTLDPGNYTAILSGVGGSTGVGVVGVFTVH